MQAVTTIGLDIAKSVFQIHGVDAAGNVIVRRQLKRRYVLPFFQRLPPCLIGIEACASSHHWSRELKALGHTVRLMPAAYVKPYVKRQKNDAADAEAICEAVTRANMRFVATKTLEQQSCLMLHRTRHLFIRQQTAVINSIRAHPAEFGIVARVGRQGVEDLLDVVADPKETRVPEVARACVAALGIQLRMLKTEMSKIAVSYGATIDKYVGDAIMGFFGDPASRGSKEDAIACVKMVIAMQRRMRELQLKWLDLGSEKPFQLRIGVNTGFCTVGNFGSEDRMDYTIIGNEVNLAARLQSHAELGGILVAHETASLIKD